MVGAEEAFRIGLVSEVVDDGAFLDTVLAHAADVAATAPIASRLTKVALQDGGHADFEAALHWEALAQPVTLATEDLQEGVRRRGSAGRRSSRAADRGPWHGPGAPAPTGGSRGRALVGIPRYRATWEIAAALGRGRGGSSLRRGQRPPTCPSLTCLPLASDGPSVPGASCAEEPRGLGEARSTRTPPPLWTMLWIVCGRLGGACGRPFTTREESCGRHARAGPRTAEMTCGDAPSTGCGHKKVRDVTQTTAGAQPPQPPLEPGSALRRIAFLLERTRADTYKVKAFRGAAATVLGLSPDELRARADAGTLRELEGIGKATEAVILEALAGEVPAYLADLERTSSAPLASGGAETREVLRGDLHSHSDWSDGGSPIEEMVMTAMELGHEYLALTDHSPRLTVANGLSVARLKKQLDVVDAVNSHLGDGFRLLRGIEVDILDDGALDQTEEMLGRLDVVVASVHSKLRMDAGPMTRRMVAAVRNPRTNVLGHCTGRLVTGGRGTRPQSEFDAEAVFTACAENDVAVEINSRPERQDPPDELVEMALGLGCLFSIDSDAHAPGQLDFLALGAERAQRLGVPPERIITTWPVEDLLAWAKTG